MEFFWKSGGNLKVTRNNSHSLILERSKSGAFVKVALYIVILVIFFFAILSESEGQNNKGHIDAVELIFLIVIAGFLVPNIVISINTILKGDIYKFQKKHARIIKNKGTWFKFRETTGVSIKHQYDHESEKYTYLLYLISVGERQYWLDESRDLQQIKFIAELIAETLDVNVSTLVE